MNISGTQESQLEIGTDRAISPTQWTAAKKFNKQP